MLRAALPVMRKQRSGTIVNVGSAAGKIAIPFQAHYCGAKFALEGLAEALRHEVRPFGIRVILIEPGDVGTTIWKESLRTGESAAYHEALDRFQMVKEQEMGDRPDPPAKVAREIADAIESGSEKFRWPVAGARFMLLARRLLPDRLFLPLVSRHYKIIS
jgi:short-subunit dehydrogenase